MSIKLFTSSDLDGVSCAIVCTLFDRKTDVVYTTVAESDKVIHDFLKDASIQMYDAIYITDLPISVSAWEDINKHKHANKFMLIDHHMKSQELLQYSSRGVLHIGFLDEYGINPASSAEQFYTILKHKHPHTYSTVVEPICVKLIKYLKAVSSWDTFTWVKDPSNDLPVRLNMLQSIYTKEIFVKSIINKLYSPDDFILPGGEYDIIEYGAMCKKNYIQKRINSIIQFTYNKYKFGLIFADEHIPDLVDEIFKADNKFDIIAIVDISTSTVHLFTEKPSIDTLVIAKQYGGDGHSHASKFVYNNDAVNLFIEKIFKP